MNVDIHFKSTKATTLTVQKDLKIGSSTVESTLTGSDMQPTSSTEQTITPWDVVAEDVIDYEKVIRDFGSTRITPDLIERFETLTKHKAHCFLRRGIFFSHRDLTKLLDLYESGTPFYLYTGRGPSSDAMHLGHLVPFLFTKWLQDVFQVPLVIQITDDEKFLWKDITQEKMDRLANENIRDILALGFDVERTFVFKDYEYLGHMYRVVSRIQKCITASQARNCFGFQMDDNIGKWSFAAIQAAPSFSSAFPHIFDITKAPRPCLIPCAIDQDPYFRLTRDIAPRLHYLKPALIHSSFFPSLLGPETKMSASNSNTAVYLSDSDSQIHDKVQKFAFSGGGATRLEHWTLGGNVDIDVPIQWLTFFLEDDEELERLKWGYATGRIMSGEIKAILIQTLQNIVRKHKLAKETITDEVLRAFQAIRPLKGGDFPL